MIPHLGMPELIIILVLVLIIFGVGRLSEVGRALGKGVREFRKAQSEIEDIKKTPLLEEGEKEAPSEPEDKE
ncbi:MAG: twin-arginine translocase TatA/TatE family subunit [Anaerolineae bacterium]